MRHFVMVAGLLLMVGMVFGADIDGKWTGSLSTPNGDFPMTYTFKAEGSTLTGSTSGMDGSPIPIKDGKIDGNNISFSVSLDFGGQATKIDYKGVLSGDQLKLNWDFMGQPTSIVLKKVQ
jgi:hypothetical protein